MTKPGLDPARRSNPVTAAQTGFDIPGVIWFGYHRNGHEWQIQFCGQGWAGEVQN